MKITESVLLQFRQEDKTKFAQESTNATRFINSLDISSNGESMISSADDEFIYVYDLLSGPSPERGLRSKRYGADIIRYTNASNTAIHSSTRVNDAIRYYSVHDNKYIRFFEGHDKKVVMLSMSPVDDTFLSGSLDETIRMWDLRHPVCVGLMRMNGRPVGNYDPEGLIFAAGIGSDTIKLYDLRSFEKGPFSSFNIPKDPIEYSSSIEWTSLKFSLDGKYILLSTNGSLIKLIDSFSGSVVQTFSGYLNAKNQPLEASFTPDAQFVLSGSSDGKIHIWDVDKGRKVGALQSDHFEPIHGVQFNPKFMMFATACQQIDFWRPPNDKP